ncbi:ATP-binding protein, partial [Pseudoxanthomonas sp. SGD-10]
EIRLEAYVGSDLYIVADADMLNLILRNILYNAIKFSPMQEVIKFTAKQKNGFIVISVADNGAGIPLAKQKQLFSFQAKSSIGTNNEKGTGIGLMLCREYTLLQGGNIWFNSKEGKGTTFYLSFPAGKPFEKEEGTLPTRAPSL